MLLTDTAGDFTGCSGAGVDFVLPISWGGMVTVPMSPLRKWKLSERLCPGPRKLESYWLFSVHARCTSPSVRGDSAPIEQVMFFREPFYNKNIFLCGMFIPGLENWGPLCSPFPLGLIPRLCFKCELGSHDLALHLIPLHTALGSTFKILRSLARVSLL